MNANRNGMILNNMALEPKNTVVDYLDSANEITQLYFCDEILARPQVEQRMIMQHGVGRGAIIEIDYQ